MVKRVAIAVHERASRVRGSLFFYSGILSASDQLMLVTVGADIYTSVNSGKSFKQIS
jgi:hypothetical protein